MASGWDSGWLHLAVVDFWHGSIWIVFKTGILGPEIKHWFPSLEIMYLRGVNCAILDVSQLHLTGRIYKNIFLQIAPNHFFSKVILGIGLKIPERYDTWVSEIFLWQFWKRYTVKMQWYSLSERNIGSDWWTQSTEACLGINRNKRWQSTKSCN